MKRLTILLAFALVLVYGCKKEESSPQLNDQNSEKSDFAGYVLNLNSESPVWEYTALVSEESNSSPSALKQNNSAHTHGDFIAFNGSLSLSWSGTQNNGGTHGSAVYEQVMNLPFPPFVATVIITMETECVSVDGDEAVYGGTFTQVENNPFPSGGPFVLGNILYFKVIDNGQGNNASADQHANLMIISSVSECGIRGPEWAIWGLFGYSDVAAPGSVKVN